MRLYNQKRVALKFDIGGESFSCGPYDDVEIPEKYLPLIGSRGLPLKSTVIPPETRAARKAQDAKADAEKDAIVRLGNELKESRAALREAQREIERTSVAITGVQAKGAGVSGALSSAASELRAVKQNLAASESKVVEQARHIALLESQSSDLPALQELLDESQLTVATLEKENALMTDQLNAKPRRGRPPKQH